MPTTDERREVAARLRELAHKNSWLNGATLTRAIDVDIEGVGFVEADVITWSRLADLIEPEPERTCERTWEHSGPLFDSFKCSECLYEFFEPRCVHGYSDLVANYCPNCGAKVVGE